MRPSVVRLTSLLALAVVGATPVLAQSRGDYIECYRDGRRVSCDDARRDRALDRAREARERANDARERALERAREVREQAQERARIARERAADDRRRSLERQRDFKRQWDRDAERRREIERRERRRWRDDSRTTFGLGGGADIRRFADVNRYFANAHVDFHSRSGLGVRPEVVYAWTDQQTLNVPAYLSTCSTCTVPPVVSSAGFLQFRARSQMLGVGLNGTYSFLRGSIVRPYLLAGVSVLSTRETRPVVTSAVPLATSPTFQQATYNLRSDDHVDIGLNAGAGLELGRGPVRAFAEFRYLLNDTPSPLGFSGALPISVGLRF